MNDTLLRVAVKVMSGKRGFLVLLVGFLVFASASTLIEPSPVEASSFRCTVTRVVTLPPREEVLAVGEESSGYRERASSEFGAAFPKSCQDRLKLGTYVIDMNIEVSLRLSSNVGLGQNGASVGFSAGVVKASEVSLIYSSSFSGTDWPYYAQAENSDFAGVNQFDPAVCFPTACVTRVRAIGLYSFADSDNVLAIYALLFNCVAGGIPGAALCPEDDSVPRPQYLPGLEGARLTLSANANITPLYEIRR